MDDVKPATIRRSVGTPTTGGYDYTMRFKCDSAPDPSLLNDVQLLEAFLHHQKKKCACHA